jgi:hypothetical protein
MFELRAGLTLAAYDRPAGTEVIRAALHHFPQLEPWPDVIAAKRLLGI